VVYIEASLPTLSPCVSAWYAEDVMRTVEREVKEVEAEIRSAASDKAWFFVSLT
jgi:hypothetical protein